MKIIQSPGAVPDVRRIRVHFLCATMVIVLLSLSATLPTIVQPVHLCMGTVVFLALSRPVWSDPLSVFLYGAWMDALHSWFKGYALAFVVVYLLIQGLLRIVRVQSVATRTAVGAGAFTVIWAARWLLSEVFGAGGFPFRWLWLVVQPALGAGWTLLCFSLFERVERWGKERALIYRPR